MGLTNRMLALKIPNISKIRIKKTNSTFIYLQLLYILIVFFLRDVLGFPSFITYITDLLLILSFIVCLGNIKKTIKKANANFQFKVILLIFLSMIIGVVVNFVNPLYVIWGFRNNFRFFLFWISCIVLLQKEDIGKLLKLFSIFFWINIFAITIQYFIFGIAQDQLGGLFGIENGCNAYAIILCCITLCYAIAQYYGAKIKLLNVLLYCVAVFYWAALAELKVLYVEVGIIMILTALFLKPSVKKLLLIVTMFSAVIFGYLVLLNVFPDQVSSLTSLDGINSYLTSNGYTNTGDLNRFTALSEIQNKFFKGNWLNTLFGFGLGNCDTSSFEILSTPFFIKYEYLHYRWFTHAWLYLEQGAIGLSLLLLFLLSIFIFCFRRRNNLLGRYYIMTALYVVTTLIGVIYNSSLQMESGYLIAFMLSVPFIISKDKDKRPANKSQGKISRKNKIFC